MIYEEVLWLTLNMPICQMQVAGALGGGKELPESRHQSRIPAADLIVHLNSDRRALRQGAGPFFQRSSLFVSPTIADETSALPSS